MTERPNIAYPCEWSYRLVGETEAALQEAVARVLGDLAFTLTESNRSTGGRYVSFALLVTVQDESHRLALFEALREEPATRFVL